jgi:Mce-associated membrane protein
VTDDKNDNQDTTVTETAAVPEEAEQGPEQTDEQTTDEPTTDESTDAPKSTTDTAAATDKRRIDRSRVLAFVVLPVLALVLAGAAGFLKWQDSSVRTSDVARTESVQAAKDSTIALLSYQPDTVEQQLVAARERLTGEFRDSYTKLTNDVVIPGAKEKQISAVASVPAAASVSANPGHAVVLVFVDQTVVIGADPPTQTASSVRITMEKIDGRWLISNFEPI